MPPEGDVINKTHRFLDVIFECHAHLQQKFETLQWDMKVFLTEIYLMSELVEV